MFKPAFSTVACPEWTLAEVARRAREYGFEAVELRTFGDGPGRVASDPALTSEEKVQRTLQEGGVEALSLATGIRFDAPIWPPVVGLFLSDRERAVREAKRAVDLAVAIECPMIRVFGFDLPGFEGRKTGVKRVAERVGMVADHADKYGVRVAVENGGSFGTAEQVLEITSMVNHALVGVSYSLSAAVIAGEDPVRGLARLGEKLFLARVKDVKAGKLVALGEGELGCERFVRSLAARGFEGALVYEWDRAWEVASAGGPLAGPDAVLGRASRLMFEWAAKERGTGVGGAMAGGVRSGRG